MNTAQKTIIKSSVAAIGLAAVVLVTLVLPAELGIDPLGTGKLTGLIGLSAQADSRVTPEQSTFFTDEVSFTLGTFESVEYKYEIAAGSAMVFGWSAPAAITYDFHGEPNGGPEGFAESYDQGKADAVNGTFIAPFGGRHGWFFENRTFAPVDVRLVTSSFSRLSYLYRDGFVTTTDLGAPGK
jgi:hypothetical protein